MSGSDLIDNAVTDAVAADAIFSGNERRKSAFPSAGDEGHCSNCGTALKGPICHSCGQDADTFHRPVWSLVLEVLDGFFSFDGRFWRTIPALMFRPGRITRHYLSGVRARYVQPFRLFIVASLAFFLVFSIDSTMFDGSNSDGEQLAEAERALAQAEEDNPEIAAQLAQLREQVGEAEEAQRDIEADPLVQRAQEQQRRDEMERAIREALLPEDYPDAVQDDTGVPVSRELADGTTLTVEADGADWLPYSARSYLADRLGHAIQDPDSWWRAVQEWTPRLIFVLLPIYALLLALMHFWRRGIFLYDHLVVSLHFHSFLFFLMTALILASPLIGGWGVLVFMLWSNFYLYRLHRRVYLNGRFKSLVRVVLLDLIYLIVLTVAFLLLLAVGLFLA
ncbi:DUF3667 domain-containing protein [Hyphobacterium sp. SN044]|uniref:DUF3667 domain-containing protein n=1 Tax=Hyphobacterium sp. SN044 TaxID=2912575 RepID=UPI001F40BD28|nr:DUF3667 domain-containing protein [Hyphobacterium sp. SN044]MCF8879215.1 DUF3667 domain-containing protein [Hyphobacterium sp. SN044]